MKSAWLTLAVMSCTSGLSEPPPRAREVAGASMTTEGSLGAPRRFVGVLTVAESATVAPRDGGVIARVHADVGDRVAAGQLVAEMDRAQLREELHAAEATLAVANAALRTASVDLDGARAKVTLETASVASGISATATLDQAKLELARAEAAWQRAIAARGVETARTQTARDRLADAELRAPFAGTVSRRYRDAGNRVDAGTPILLVVSHGQSRLRFAVPPELAASLVAGTAATAIVDTIATPVAVTIKHVSPTLDPASGMVIVEAELTGREGRELLDGVAAWVELPTP